MYEGTVNCLFSPVGGGGLIDFKHSRGGLKEKES